MKTKILSLALALMMILSVAATLPVSAVTSAELESVYHIKLNAYDLQNTDSAADNYMNNKAIKYYSWTPGGDVEWDGAQKGVAEFANPYTGSAYANYNFNVAEGKAGMYDLYLAAGGTSDVLRLTVSVNGTKTGIVRIPNTGKLSTMSEVYFGAVYLNEGANAVRFTAQNGNAYSSGALLVRNEAKDSAPTILHTSAYTEVKVGTARVGVDYGTLASELDYTTSTGVQFYRGLEATVYNDVYVPTEAGYYNLKLAYGASATSSVSIYNNATSGERLSADLASTESKYTVAEVDMGSIYMDKGMNRIYTILTPVADAAETMPVATWNMKLTRLDVQPALYTITTEATEGGSVTASSTVKEGESATITATPSKGYMFDGWYQGTTKVSSDASYTINEVTADASYTAKFKAYILINPRNCTFVDGTPGTTYQYTHWNSAPNYSGMTWGAGLGTNLYGFDKTSPSYKDALTTELTVTKEGFYDVLFATGTVGAASARAVVAGQTITGTLQDTGSSTTVMENYIGSLYIADGDTISFYFDPSSTGHLYLYDILLRYSDEQPTVYEITAEVTEGGSVSGGGIVAEGESATITATPDAGYTFDGWYLNGSKVEGAGATYTIDSVTADAKYTAKFKVALFIEPREATKNETTSDAFLWNHGGTPVYEGMDWGDGENDSVRFYYGITDFSRYLSGTITAAKSGYYDVMIAAGTKTGASAKFVVGYASVTGDLEATGAKTNVKGANLGRIYLTAGEAADYKLYATSGSGSDNDTYIYDVMLSYSDDQTKPLPDPVVLKLEDGKWTSRLGIPEIAAAQTDASSWIIGKMYLLNGTEKDTGVFENVVIAEDGWYDIYFGAGYYWGGYNGANFRMDIYDNISGEDVKIASNLAVGDVSGYSYTAAKSVMVASVYLEKGTHKITVAGTNGAAPLVGMQFVCTGFEKTATTLSFTDKDGKAVTSVTGGSEVFAEILSTEADARIFLVQYAGEGDERTMVATTYLDATTSHDQTADGKNLYRAKLKTVAGAGEVKAFLWSTDEKYIPLAATETLSVN